MHVFPPADVNMRGRVDYHRLPGTAVATLTFAPEDKEKGLGSETQVHRAQDSVVIDLSKDIVDWQGIVDHRR